MISWCLGFRRWHEMHLHRCLQSIARFRAGDVIIVTTPEDSDTVLRCARPAGDLRALVLVRSMDEWSRSYALNEAAKLAITPYLCFTDADMIFASNWYDVAIKHVQHDQIWLTDSRDFAEGQRYDVPINDSWLFAKTTPHDRVGQGGAMLMPRWWFRSVGGFDEYYRVWGAEDNDLVLRAEWDQRRVDWLPNTFVAHQWHRRDWPTEAQFKIVERNRAYLRQRIDERGPIVRNTQ